VRTLYCWHEPTAGMCCCAHFHLQDSLGEPVLEVELCVGDVLYMPRGTVHQATAQTVDSSHLTISTYQRCSYADLATHLLQVRYMQLHCSWVACSWCPFNCLHSLYCGLYVSSAAVLGPC
jgi:hypothetical protein